VRARRAPLLVLALGLVGSQAGHLLAYEARFGTAAAQLQSSGAHVYFPVVAKTGLGVGAAFLLAAFFVVALARALSGRALRRDEMAPSYLAVLAGLFTLQLACYAAQETAEAALAGIPASSVGTLLLWGSLGQLPVAVMSAIALRWLLARFDAAVSEIRSIATLTPPRHGLVPAAVALTSAGGGLALQSCSARSPITRRGPPSFLRFSSH
jgi:hypothetical protein